MSFFCNQNRYNLSRQKIVRVILIAIVIVSCNPDNQKISTNIKKTVTYSDSVDIWVNTDYLNCTEEDISICDCWSKCQYVLLYCDTSNMEIYLKSNLMHFGHDSELILPIQKTENWFRYDSTLGNYPVEAKAIKWLSEDTLSLIENKIHYQFIKYSFALKNDNTTKNKYAMYSDFSDLFYQLNSHILLKYSIIDSAKSTSLLITPDTLKNMILNGMVTGHCSDDYYFDGMTINNDSPRYFHLNFKKGEIELYERHRRMKYQKPNLDTLSKQVLRIGKD